MTTQARIVLKREETKRSWGEARSWRSCAAECRDFTLRDWTEHSLAGIAKIEACTCPARKGRVFYACSRSPYSFFISSFSSFQFAGLLSTVLPLPHSKLLLSCVFPPPRFRFGDSFLVILTMSISPHFSLSLSPIRLLLDGTLRFFSPSCVTRSLRVALYLLLSARCLVVHVVTLFLSTHAANAVSRLAHVGHRVRSVRR